MRIEPASVCLISRAADRTKTRTRNVEGEPEDTEQTWLTDNPLSFRHHSELPPPGCNPPPPERAAVSTFAVNQLKFLFYSAPVCRNQWVNRSPSPWATASIGAAGLFVFCWVAVSPTEGPVEKNMKERGGKDSGRSSVLFSDQLWFHSKRFCSEQMMGNLILKHNKSW